MEKCTDVARKSTRTASTPGTGLLVNTIHRLHSYSSMERNILENGRMETSGSKYSRDWHAGKRHGRGIEKYANGEIYSGN